MCRPELSSPVSYRAVIDLGNSAAEERGLRTIISSPSLMSKEGSSLQAETTGPGKRNHSALISTRGSYMFRRFLISRYV